jgi:hypothetical protein
MDGQPLAEMESKGGWGRNRLLGMIGTPLRGYLSPDPSMYIRYSSLVSVNEHLRVVGIDHSLANFPEPHSYPRGLFMSVKWILDGITLAMACGTLFMSTGGESASRLASQICSDYAILVMPADRRTEWNAFLGY